MKQNEDPTLAELCLYVIGAARAFRRAAEFETR